MVVSPAQWRRNFTPDAPLLERHRGVVIPGQGVLDADPDRVAAVVNALLSAGARHQALGLKLVKVNEIYAYLIT